MRIDNERVLIGFVEATVRFPLYEGDRTEGSWEDFVYEEPGIARQANGSCDLAVCRREAETITALVHLTK